MQLTPVYGDRAVIVTRTGLADLSSPSQRQRARLSETLAGLDDEQWAAPSRCAGWSVQDVVAHLVTVNQYWGFSIDCGLRGEPSRVLAAFDPVVTPAEMVGAVRSATPQETLSSFVESHEGLTSAIERIGGAWDTVAEAPPGHLAVDLVLRHALWDSWVHERDILLPLGMAPVVESDEVTACLPYAAALSPAFLATVGSTRQGAVELDVTDPDLRCVVDVGEQVVIHDGPAPDDAIRIAGDAVDVLEALSHRGPFPKPLADEDRWVLHGLDLAFDVAN